MNNTNTTTNSQNQRLSDEEAWNRAREVLPGLVGNQGMRLGRRVRRTVEDLLFELLDERVLELKGTPDNFRRLMKPENTVELCVALGLNKEYTTKRFTAISNIRTAFNLRRKTSALDSVRDLIRRIPLNQSID